jgi:hypothetical protein
MIRVHVFDRQGAEDVVPVLFLLREGWELISVRVYDDGTRGDRLAGDGFYLGETIVPRSAAPGDHWFVVYLYDREGNRSNMLLHEFYVTADQKTL